MKYITIGCLILVYVTRLTFGTCVFDSDFGFTLNCNFKKSSLFRVRNLGGVKAHFGLGFSVGDELGFAESLGNVEGNKRRSLNERQTINTIGVLPASKQPAIQKSTRKPIQQNNPQAWTARPQPVIYQKSNGLAMTEAVSLPLGVPPFRPVPKTYSALSTPAPTRAVQGTFNKKVMQERPMQIQLANMTYVRPVRVQPSSAVQSVSSNSQTLQPSVQFQVPAFQALPQSVTKVSSGQIVKLEAKNDLVNRNVVYPSNYVKREDVNQPSGDDPSQFIAAQPFTSQLQLPKVNLMGHTIEELASAANVSVDAIQKAIQMKQQQLLTEQQAAMYKQQIEIMKKLATTTAMPTRPATTTTTQRPTTKKYIISGGSKVMNAPKEYYPAGYEKNFDDNFVSKVDLPATSFHCGDQKHFPGLYGDMDLGCMVFHVCALTDDGLIMKSFLCPESTLFDQTILKCNWWFYVDCKSSKSLYDSNLPVSKSYQLMKALTFFSNYKNSGSDNGGVDVEALKNSVKSNETA